MPNFISKLTFGFLMAQFFPGAIFVLSLSSVYMIINKIHSERILEVHEVINASMHIWWISNGRFFLFSVLSIAAGMAIHGLHWAVLGFIENFKKESEQERNSVARSFWHENRIILQIIGGPIKIVFEILWMLFCGESIKKLAIQENVGKLDHAKIEGFKFLQDFYLHFAQFYAHTSYAMVVLIPVPITIMCSPSFNFSWPPAFLLLASWVGCGFFFTISRVQFQSLWQAEESLSLKTHNLNRNAP